MQARRVLTAVIVLVLAADVLLASTGSTYSRFGVGDRRHFASVRSAALGGSGIALRGPAHINIINPASWSDLPIVQFNGSLYYENVNSDDGRTSGGLATGSINGATLALPVMPSRGITIAFGFGPMTRIGYNVESGEELDTGAQTINYNGSGGITNGYAGLSYRPHDHISIGAMALYRIGVLRYNWSSEYTATGFASGSTERVVDVEGIAGHLGLLYSGLLPKRGDDRTGPLSIGLVFTTPTKLSAEERFRISYPTGADTVTIRTGTIRLPYLVGVGVGYSVDDRNTVALDFRYEPWEDFERFGAPDTHLKNAFRIGGGWEREGRYELGAGFFERASLRVGFLYNASYFNIQNTPINETFVTLGAGIPVSGIAVLDVAAQVGLRGTLDNNLQRDLVFRLLFSLNIFERWFVPPVIE
jgi:hypothetical protein